MKIIIPPRIKRHIHERKLIASNEGRISLVQIIGFALIFIGVGYILYKIFIPDDGADSISGEEIAIIFFIIMLGVSFAFPSLLQDQNKSLSTMRIIVFMLANVICLLLLKIGWGVANFKDIGIDQYWVGIIAFIFGAKATQAFFESKMAVPKQEPSKVTTIIGSDSLELAKKALAIHGEKLKSDFPNIITSLEIGNTINNKIGIIANLKNNPPPDFPKSVSVELENGNSVKIEIEAIVDVIAEAHYGLQCRVRNQDMISFTGALGGVLLSKKQNDDSKLFITCSHVVLKGRSVDLGGYDKGNTFNMNIQILGKKGTIKGNLLYAKLDAKNDTAIVKLKEDSSFDWNNDLPDGNGNTFGPAISILDLDDASNVAFYSSKKKRVIKGKIHKKCSKNEVRIRYSDSIVKSFFDLIVVGDNFGTTWSSISKGGDSGSILYDENYRPFGLIIGGSNVLNDEGNTFTYAIPILQILEETDTKIHQS